MDINPQKCLLYNNISFPLKDFPENAVPKAGDKCLFVRDKNLCIPVYSENRRSPILENLISYWALDEEEGALVAEDSMGRFPLSPTSNILKAGKEGRVGNCWGRFTSHYDALISKEAILNASEYASSWSINIWFRTPDGGGRSGNSPLFFIAKNNGGNSEERTCPGMYINDENYVRFAPYPFSRTEVDSGAVGSYIDSSNMDSKTDNSWHMLTGTYIPGNAVLYIDGVMKASKPLETISTQNGYPAIGGSAWNQVNSLYFDEVGLWSRALTADEVSFLYNNGNGVSLKSMIGEI